MKYHSRIILSVGFCLVQTASGDLSEAQRIEREQVQMWESKLESARDLEPEEKIKALWLGLRNMGWRRSFPDHSAAVDNIYRKIQTELLSTPGHARYFADEVERLIADPKNAGTSVRERSWYLRQTLMHLPSPETIQVLGSYLYDERFSLDPDKDNSGAFGPTYIMAAVALKNIGLREPEEVIRTEGFLTKRDLESIRRWWELVKSGERTFSFKGQDVEYRFKPDGTWETIPLANPPEDGPKPTEAEPATPPAREAPSQPVETKHLETSSVSRWIWVIVAVVLVTGLFGFQMLRKRQA